MAHRALATLLGSDVFPAPGLPGGHGAAPDGPNPDSGALGGKLRLFALSFLMLFVELALMGSPPPNCARLPETPTS